jgi:hypothetical protein
MNFVEHCLSLRPKVKDWNPDKHTNIQYVQEKKNGYFLSLIVDEKGKFHAIGKKQDYTKEIIHREKFWRFHNIPANTCIFGELYLSDRYYSSGKCITNYKATDTITAIKEGWNDLDFSAFAMPYYDGIDLTKENLGYVNHRILDLSISIPWMADHEKKFDKEFLLYAIEKKGYEGFVLKEAHMTGWYKLKPVKTIDVIITGWEKSWSPQFFEELGALRVSVYTKDGSLKEIAKVGGGFTPKQRKAITKEDIGKVIEVAYQDLQSKGRLQFPRFICFRDDKPKEECVEDQLNA